jgi:hypothetical protein
VVTNSAGADVRTLIERTLLTARNVPRIQSNIVGLLIEYIVMVQLIQDVEIASFGPTLVSSLSV